MKVLSVNHLLSPQTGGGTAERAFQLSRFFLKGGVACTLATLDIGVTAERIYALGDVKFVGLPCLNERYFVPRVSLSAMDRLVADADVVHLMGHWTLLNALAYKSCRRLNKPYVFCPAGALKPFGRSLALKRIYDAWVGVDIARNASACVAITEDERSEFSTYGVAPERVVVIPNGIDPVEYSGLGIPDIVTVQEKFALPRAPYILFLGRLSEIKGPDLLLDAFTWVADQLPHTHLVFAGPDGGMLQGLTERTRRCRLVDRVHFTDYISGSDKVALLRGAELLVIPSRREAMSIVVLEAGICGTPVLFTNTCGLGELASERAGTMVGVSGEALAEGLLSLLSNLSEATQAAERLSAIVNERYLWRIQADRYLALFSRLLTTGVR